MNTNLTLISYISAVFGAKIAADLALVFDGKIHRFDIEGRPKGKKHGWYVGHDAGEYQLVNFGDWQTGLKDTWCSKQANTMTKAEAEDYKTKLQQLRKAAEAEALRLANEAKTKAVRMLNAAHDVSGNHAYLQAKRIVPYGARQLKDMLLIPVTIAGELASVQVIHGDGKKTFLTGGNTKGGYCLLGDPGGDVVLVCEGWATGCTLHQATGYPVYVAFNAGNLSPVAQAVRQRQPAAKILLCGDDDWKTEGNPGLTHAKAAGGASCGAVVMPVFPVSHDRQPKETDFNDLAQVIGLAEVKGQIEAVFTPPCQEVTDTNLNNSKGGLQDFSDDNGINGDTTPATVQESEEAYIKHLATLPLLAYAKVRSNAADTLGVPVSILDRLVKAEQNAAKQKEEEAGGSGGVILFEDIEEWPTEVQGDAVLDAVFALLQRYVIADPSTLRAAALWCALTWFSDYATVLPLAVITAPEKGCGKSTLLQAIAKLACRPLYASNITPAALFRAVESWKPSLMIDEADTFAKENEELRGIINSGHTRDTAVIVRAVEINGEYEPRAYSTWGAKAMAGIGKLPETIMSRAIVLTMRRKMRGEAADNLRHADKEAFRVVKRQLARWSSDIGEYFGTYRPDMGNLHNRAADNWEPLYSLADLAGGRWPTLARQAAKQISGEEQESPSLNEELLTNIRDAFETKKADTLFSQELLELLCEDEEGVWATYNRGKPLSLRQLSKRLEEFGIKPRTVRKGFDTKKGYQKAWFNDSFLRYLSDTPISPVTPTQHNKINGLYDFQSVTPEIAVTDKNNANSLIKKECDGVTDTSPLLRGKREEREAF